MLFYYFLNCADQKKKKLDNFVLKKLITKRRGTSTSNIQCTRGGLNFIVVIIIIIRVTSLRVVIMKDMMAFVPRHLMIFRACPPNIGRLPCPIISRAPCLLFIFTKNMEVTHCYFHSLHSLTSHLNFFSQPKRSCQAGCYRGK